jgi:rhodanese-related sulfurtransferase
MVRNLPHPLRALALLAAAGLCAILANAVAGPHRKLAWTGWVPPAAAITPVTALPPPVAVQAEPPPVHAPKAAPKPVPQPPRFAADPASVERELSSGDAWAAYTLHLPFLDARRTPDYTEGHVAGAWNVPVWEASLDARVTEFEALANPGPKDPIVIYCSGGGCEDSHLLARKLVALGYRNLLIYEGGFPDWLAQARPVRKGGTR